METLLILLQQSKAGAMIEILAMLVVAAAIGFLTAYFYYKPIYEKKIKALDFEKEGLLKEISVLESDKSKLEKNLSEKSQELEQLKKEGKG